MQRNKAGQKIALFAFDYTTGAPKTGDAANLTAYVSKDWGTPAALGDTSATEIDATNDPGGYRWDLTQAETDAEHVRFSGKSSTANVVVVAREYYTRVDAPIAFGTAQGGSSTTIQFAASMAFANDILVGALVSIIGGTGAGQSRYITDHVSGTDTATVDPAWVTNPDNTSIYVVWPAGPVDVPTAAAVAAAVLAAATSTPIAANLKALNDQTASAANLERAAATQYRGTVTGSPTTTSFVDSALPSTEPNNYNGRIIFFTGGDLDKQGTRITGYNESTKTLTFEALSSAPATSDPYVIV